MPQLNPSPWLMIFMLTWTFFFIFLNKAFNSYYPNLPTTKMMEISTQPNWNWPWY